MNSTKRLHSKGFTVNLTLAYIDDSQSYLMTVARGLLDSSVAVAGKPLKFKLGTFDSDRQHEQLIASSSDPAPDIVLIDFELDDTLRAGLTLAKKARHAFPEAVKLHYPPN